VILGYLLADSGGTAIIVREFVPIFTKEGRNFFAQISSIMYSFVESLVHSELKHVETENIHLYFARLNDFILVLFSDVEDDKLGTLAGNIVKIISDLGYDAFSIQLDDDVREEVIGVIEKNIITIPPNINFVKKIITMIIPLMEKEKNVRLNLSTFGSKEITIEELARKRKLEKIKDFKQEKIAKLMLNGKFSKIIEGVIPHLKSRKKDIAALYLTKSALLNRLINTGGEHLSLEELSKIVSDISHPVLKSFLQTEIKSYNEIKEGVDRKLYYLKHRRMFFTKILTETKESILYALLSFPPTDTETAKVLKNRFGEENSLCYSYCDDFMYCYRTFLMKETSQEIWLLTMGEIYDKMVKFMDMNKTAGLTYLRSYIVNTLASIVQEELKVGEVLNVLETFLNNWKGWEKEIRNAKSMWHDIKLGIYDYYLELVKWYILAKDKENLPKNLLRDLEKKAIEFLRFALGLFKNSLVPLVQLYKPLSTIIMVLSEIMTISGKYSEDIINLIDEIVSDDLTLIWSENPAEYAIIYKNLLSTLTNMAKFVKLESVRKNILAEIGKELLSIAEAFEKLPMIYWLTLVDSIRALMLSDEAGVKLAKTVVSANEQYAPPYIAFILRKFAQQD